nr:MAG TPA_asm: hypothetical protein [Caudoviricetes sp.]
MPPRRGALNVFRAADAAFAPYKKNEERRRGHGRRHGHRDPAGAH